MREPDFDRLKRAPAPPPSEGAKQRAVSAAMDAFDEARAKKSAERLKGSNAKGRLTSARPASGATWPWRILMQNRLAIGGAAVALAAVPISAVLLSQHDYSNLAITSRQSGGEPQIAEVEKKKDATRIEQPSEQPARPAVAPKQELEAVAPPPPPAAPIEQRADARAQRRLEVQRRFPVDPAMREAAPQTFARDRIGNLVAPSPVPPSDMSVVQEDRDRFEGKSQNAVKITADEPVSTFSIDADTASYSWVRRSLMQGRLPSPDAVRIEELINYFPYDYAAPSDASVPFKPSVAVAPSPWNKDTRLVRIGIKGFEAQAAARPKANLVFLVDVSGSMQSADKLPLVKASLKLLLAKLSPDDSVSLVTYAGGVGVALEPTKASERDKILGAIDRLKAGGSTAGAAGIEEAYRLARQNFDAKGVNRVMIATDGDFNVGVSDDDGLTRLIETERQSGVFLSVLGFGQGNYNDALMQRLAQNGNGTAAYIDQLEEAQKVLVEEATSTLFPIAKDVKIQVEFNPTSVSEYRLIGYETRQLKREDFRNDKVDAGEVGSGATVTALYEIVPVGSPARLTEDLRYGDARKPAATAPAGSAEEFGYLKMRYKLPTEDVSREIAEPIGKALDVGDLSKAPDDMRFAAAVAAFGQKLKGSAYGASMSWDEIAALASGARGEDRWGYRAGFVRLVGLAKALSR